MVPNRRVERRDGWRAVGASVFLIVTMTIGCRVDDLEEASRSSTIRPSGRSNDLRQTLLGQDENRTPSIAAERSGRRPSSRGSSPRVSHRSRGLESFDESYQDSEIDETALDRVVGVENRSALRTEIATQSPVPFGLDEAPSVETHPAQRDADQSVAPDRRGDAVDPDAAYRDLSTILQELVEAHNRVRDEQGFARFTVNARLVEAAQVHAEDMAQQRRMSHQGSDGSRGVDRVVRAGYRFRQTAENVAYGQRSLELLMTMWMNSPSHRTNILGPCDEIGVGLQVAESGAPYWCVTFGTARP